MARSRLSEAGWLPSVLGVVALLTGATTVFGQMQVSLNDMWGVAARPDRNSLFMFVKSRILSLTVVLAIGFVLLVSLLMGVVLRAVLHFADQFVPAVAALLTSAEMLVSLLVAALLFGTIFKVLVRPGVAVAAGEPVLVLEAMKMESEIRAVSAGVVAEVLVREGDQVAVGQPLITFS